MTTIDAFRQSSLTPPQLPQVSDYSGSVNHAVINPVSATLVQILFSTQGRLNRGSYFKYLILTLIFYMVVSILSTVIIDQNGHKDINALTLLVMIALQAWITVVLTIKRFHDLNVSGWGIVVFLIPIINLIAVLITLFLPGTKGINKFGAT